jgi:hypothetical protein
MPDSSASAETQAHVRSPESPNRLSQANTVPSLTPVLRAIPVPSAASRALSIALIACSVVDELVASDHTRRLIEDKYEPKKRPYFRDFLALSITSRTLSEPALDVMWSAPPLVPLVALIREDSWRRRSGYGADSGFREMVRLVPWIT